MPKSIVFFLCLIPLGWVFFQGANGSLGPDPGKAVVLATGIWGFRFLLVTLAVSPIATFTGWARIYQYRRMLGLYVWFYASLHFVAVWTYLLGWNWAAFLEEFIERPYMAVGIIAWLLLLPLGLTSNYWTQRRLGRNWKRLHQLIYVIALLVCAHFIWLIRSNYAEAMIYSLLVLILLVVRAPIMKHGIRSLKAK